MRRSLVFVDYFLWHYSVAFRDASVVWLNLMWFILHFFSIPLLLRTLFAPWKRITETYQRTGFEDMLATAVINVMTRVVGAIIRLIIIAAGIAVLLLFCVLFVLYLALWIALPFLIVYSFFYGIFIMI